MIKISNNKGWIKILEASIAILLIVSAVLILFFGSESNRNNNTQSIIEIEKLILTQIVNDPFMRNELIQLDEGSTIPSDVSDLIVSGLPSEFSYELKICNLTRICGPNTFHEEVYVQERVISSTLDFYDPKKIKLFVWIE